MQRTIPALEVRPAAHTEGVRRDRLPDSCADLLRFVGTQAITEAGRILVPRGHGMQGVFAEAEAGLARPEGFAARLALRPSPGGLPGFRLPHQRQPLQGFIEDGVIQAPPRLEAAQQNPLGRWLHHQRQLEDEGRRFRLWHPTCFRFDGFQW